MFKLRMGKDRRYYLKIEHRNYQPSISCLTEADGKTTTFIEGITTDNLEELYRELWPELCEIGLRKLTETPHEER